MPAHGLMSLEDEELSGISGQDGITATFKSPPAGVTVASQKLCIDNSGPGFCVPGGNANASSLMMRNMSLAKIGDNGSAAAGAFNIITKLDVGAASPGSTPVVLLRADWERARLKVGDMVLGDVGTAANISTLNHVFDGAGHFEIKGYNGLFNINETQSGISLGIDDGLVGIRTNTAANSPEMIFNNFNFLWEMSQGRVGICNGSATAGPCYDSGVGKSVTRGLLLMGDTKFRLDFDLLFDRAPTTSFVVDATDKALFHFGWSGTLTNAMFRLESGGVWDSGSPTGCYSGTSAVACGTTDPSQKYNRPQNPESGLVTNAAPLATTTQGLTLGMRWAYANDFEWTMGDVSTTTNPVTLKFGKWINLPNSTAAAQPQGWATPGDYAFSLPLLAVDMVNSGHGPGGLCWGANWHGPRVACESSSHGGQFINVDPDNNSLAVVIRDGFVRAYSTDVTILDPSSTNPANQTRKLGWSLIYTLANFNGNFFLRPEQRSNLSGMKLSGVAMSQTFDFADKYGAGNKGNGNIFEWGPNWEFGSHFMISDSDTGLGIGFMNSSIMIAAKNANFDYLASGSRPGQSSDTRPGGVSLGDPNLLDSTKAQTNAPVRFGFFGRFGGGDVPNMTKMVSGFDLNINMEMDRFNFMLYGQQDTSASAQPYLGYEGTMHFTRLLDADFSDDASSNRATGSAGSYYWMSEPGRPEASIRFSGYTGWMAIRNGYIKLNSDADTPANMPAQLEIKQDILWGRSVSTSITGTKTLASGTQVGLNEMVLPDIGLGKLGTGNSISYDTLGTMVLPAGQWYSRIVLQPKY